MTVYGKKGGGAQVEPLPGSPGVDLVMELSHIGERTVELTPAEAHALGLELIQLALRAGHRP